MSEIQLCQFALHLEALRRMISPETRIVITALFYKKDVRLSDVDGSNEGLKEIVSGLPRVEWLEAPEIDLEHHYESRPLESSWLRDMGQMAGGRTWNIMI